MRRFRNWRRRKAALALAPAAVVMTIAMFASMATVGPAAASAARSGSTALDASSHRVGPSGHVTLEGRFRAPVPKATPASGRAPSPGDGAQSIRIQFRAQGSPHWRDTRRARTGHGGRFSERVAVRRSGRFRAIDARGRTTPAQLVIVKSRTRARISDELPKVGQKLKIKGRVIPAGSRRKVEVRIGDETVRTQTQRNGRFAVRWKATETGTSTVRVRAGGDSRAAGSGAKPGKVTVLRPAFASYYGPGLYGNHLGCGGTLQPGTVGVANKSLPCGTKLTVAYGNRSVKTEVIDRGPYVGGREFDLTEALKQKLGFGSTGYVYVSR